jgi:hypothetical protein
VPRDLEVWAVSDDGEYVLLAAAEDATRATHQLRIDSRLEAAVRGDLADDDEERRESELSPKEIQARLRAGDSIESVAKAARVALPRIERYAGPVISERDRIVDQARAAVLQRARGPVGEVPLGRMVERRLAETVGLRSETVVWSARRRDDGAWVVAVSYTARGGARTAEWLWQPGARELSSINALGTRLGADDGTAPKRRRPVAPPPPASAPLRVVTPAPTPAARPAMARRPAAKPASPVRKAAVARKPVAKKAAVKKAVAKKAVVKKTVVKKAAPARPTAPSRTAAKKGATKRAAAPKLTQPPARKRAAAAKPAPRRRPTPKTVAPPVVQRDANGRAVLPSWDDVLLGVRSPATARGRRRS